MSAVAVIPARGGSRRIPRKNIKAFHGKPIIAYSIETALQTECFERVIVSTDDEDIAAVAKNYGAEVPFLREKSFADDYATTGQVMAHVIAQLALQGCEPEIICCLYATAPLLQAADLRNGLAAIQDPLIDFAFSATSFAFPVQRALRINSDQRATMVNPENMLVRSQDLEPLYHDAGQFYWGKRVAFIAQRPFFAGNSKAVVIPRQRVQDIDTEEDWRLAELLYTALMSSDG